MLTIVLLLLNVWNAGVFASTISEAVTPENDCPQGNNLDPLVEAFLDVVNVQQAYWDNQKVIAEWNYANNITQENQDVKIEISSKAAEFSKVIWRALKKINQSVVKDYSLRRQLHLYSDIGEEALPKEDYERFSKIVAEMESAYSTAKICVDSENKNCSNSLEPELTNYLKTSDDPELLKRVWVNWRNAVGPKVKDLYVEYVQLVNKIAELNGYADAAEHWVSNYEDPNFRSQIEEAWQQVRPLYLQLHAYVRYHLRKKYGDIVSEDGPIPAHLLGNMWAQDWDTEVLKDSYPYPGKQQTDLTQKLIEQGYTPVKIFKKAESFFTSINMTAMPQSFWENSVLEKPTDREIVCHASAWDFFDGKDFRIKQCTDVNFEDFHTAHHEMGHVEYYLQYKDQPLVFREGANNGFHEAVGDVIALSVTSTKHLRKVGLLDTPDDDELILNNLYDTGLHKIVFLPFGYLMDLWRWDVFRGDTKPENYNCKWWELKEKYQGIEPPVARSENDFDPAAKYHIVADVPYVRYFVSFIVQFQFHKALCSKAGEYEPNNPDKALHKCDIYESTDAGNALKSMLAMGASRPWPDAMEELTGQRKMDASSLIEYFKPLQEWLEKENEKNGVQIGWNKSQVECKAN